MALYDALFTMMDMTAAQLLVTAADFDHRSFRESLAATAEDLLEMNVIPVFNENDAVLAGRLPPVRTRIAMFYMARHPIPLASKC